MGLVHERLLNATYWKEVVGDAPEEGVDPLVLTLRDYVPPADGWPAPLPTASAAEAAAATAAVPACRFDSLPPVPAAVCERCRAAADAEASDARPDHHGRRQASQGGGGQGRGQG